MADSVRWNEIRNAPQPSWSRTPVEKRALPDGDSDHSTVASSARRQRQGSREMTVAEFVEQEFLPRHVASKRTPGRRHYQAILKHVLNPDLVDRIFGADGNRSRLKLKSNPEWPYIDSLQMSELESDHIRRLMTAALDTGYSTQTAKHIRNVVSAIVSLAIKEGCFSGPNPAILVSPPAMQRRAAHILTFDQTVIVLRTMRYPERQISLMAILTGKTIAEICGLQWKFVNLVDHSVNRENELIPPKSIAVRKQWYRGELNAVPMSRKKNLPISPLLLTMFLTLPLSRSNGWSEFVLASRSGRPINQINSAARRLKTIGTQLGIPWLSWQVFRRTRANLTLEFGARLEQELAAGLKTDSSPEPKVPRWPQ